MRIVEIHDAEATLAALIEAAVAGEEVVFARDGLRVARLVAETAVEALSPRRLGGLAGKITVPPAFDAPLPPQAVETFEGR